MTFLKIASVILIGSSYITSLDAMDKVQKNSLKKHVWQKPNSMPQRLNDNEWPTPDSAVKTKESRTLRVEKDEAVPSNKSPLSAAALKQDEIGTVVKYSALNAGQAKQNQISKKAMLANEFTEMGADSDLLSQLKAMKSQQVFVILYNTYTHVPYSLTNRYPVPFVLKEEQKASVSAPTAEILTPLIQLASQPLPKLLLPPSAQTPVEPTALAVQVEPLANLASKNQHIDLVQNTSTPLAICIPAPTPHGPAQTQQNKIKAPIKRPVTPDEDDDIVFIQRDAKGALEWKK